MSNEHVEELLEHLTIIGRRNSLRDPVANMVADIGLGPAQIHALMWLRQDGPLTMGALAQRCGITDKTITGIVDRLERESYVARERNREDRRVVHVTLAAKGRELAEELHRAVVQHLGQFLDLLSNKDRRDLIRILRNLAEKLESDSSSAQHEHR